MQTTNLPFKYSQNELVNLEQIKDLVNNSSINKNDLVIDIGAGKGAITKHLLNKNAKVIAYELDQNRYNFLKQEYANTSNIDIFKQDFLSANLPKTSFKVFSNIPFNLTANILKKCFNSFNFTEGYFIIQKEAAYKFAGKQINPSISSSMLSIIYSNNFEFKIIHNFKPKDFNPKPNVGIVLLYVKKVNKQIKNSVEFYDFVSFIFKQTNKNLIKTLGKILSSKQISTLKKHNFFNDFQIPSMLDFENFKKLYDLFESRSDTNKSIIRGSYFELLQLESKIKKDNRTRVKQKNFKY